jgi:uncharacterized protein YkwD
MKQLSSIEARGVALEPSGKSQRRTSGAHGMLSGSLRQPGFLVGITLLVVLVGSVLWSNPLARAARPGPAAVQHPPLAKHDWRTLEAPVTPSATPASAPSTTAATRAAATVAQPVVRPAPIIGSTQLSLINQDRARAGLPPLTWSPCLAAIAGQNAVRMAAQGYISHTNGVTLDLGCHLSSRSGENIGYLSGGINDVLMNNLFMNSPEHQANILGPFHYVGTAWAVAANGYAYIAVEFS